MPKGPNGEIRPADPIAAAVMTARIATGDITEEEASAELANSRSRRQKMPEAILATRSTKK